MRVSEDRRSHLLTRFVLIMSSMFKPVTSALSVKNLRAKALRLSLGVFVVIGWDTAGFAQWRQLPGFGSQIMDLRLGFYDVRVRRDAVLMFTEPNERSPRGLLHLDYLYPSMTPCVSHCHGGPHDLLQITLDFGPVHDNWKGTRFMATGGPIGTLGRLSIYQSRDGGTFYTRSLDDPASPYIQCYDLGLPVQEAYCSAFWIYGKSLQIHLIFNKAYLHTSEKLFSDVNTFLKQVVSTYSETSFQLPQIAR